MGRPQLILEVVDPVGRRLHIAFVWQMIMASVPKYIPHYTLVDYEQWQGDWELWRGVPVAMSPSPLGRHQWVSGQIVRQFLNSLDATCKDCFVLLKTDWIVADDTVVRPDVVIVCGSFPERHIMEPPRLVVEVLSPSTEEKNRTAKLDLYASQGVEYYLLVDPIAKSIDALHRESATGKYEPMPVTEVFTFEFNKNCLARLDVAAHFRVTG